MHAFRLNDWNVDPKLNRITRGRESVQLEPKVMNVLLALVSSHNEPVSQETLIERVWPDTHVSETIVRRSISELRRALGDDARDPRFIQTVPKKGYRLIAVVVDIHVEDDNQDMDSGPASPAFKRVVMGSAKRLHQRFLLLLGVPIALLLGWALWLAKTKAPALEDIYLLTDFPGSEAQIAPQPNGDLVAFTWELSDEQHVYLQPKQGRRPIRISNETGKKRSPAYAPDGRRVAYVDSSTEGDKVCLTSGESGFWHRVGFGRRMSRVIWQHARRIDSLCWRDNQTLVLSLRDGATSPLSLQLLSLGSGDVSEPQPLTSPPELFWGDRMPRKAPADERIAFLRAVTDAEEDLFISEPGQHPRRLTFEDRSFSGFDWTPDGRALIAGIRHLDRYQLWQIDVVRGEMTRLDAFKSNIIGPRISGRDLLFEEVDFTTEIWRSVRKPDRYTQPVVYISARRKDRSPRYAPDGQSVVFVSSRAGASELYMVSAAAGDLTQLTSFGGPLIANPEWASDSRYIVFEVHLDGPGHIYMLDIAGGAPRALTQGASQNRVPSFSQDGKKIYFASNREGGWQIWETTRTGDEPRRLTSDGGFRAQESRDGRFLFYNKHRTSRLWRLDLASGKQQLVVDDPMMDWQNWCLDQGSLFYIRQGLDGSPSLMRLPLQGGSAETCLLLPSLPEPYGVAASHDGAHLLFAWRGQSRGDIKVIRNFR